MEQLNMTYIAEHIHGQTVKSKCQLHRLPVVELADFTLAFTKLTEKLRFLRLELFHFSAVKQIAVILMSQDVIFSQ